MSKHIENQEKTLYKRVRKKFLNKYRHGFVDRKVKRNNLKQEKKIKNINKTLAKNNITLLKKNMRLKLKTVKTKKFNRFVKNRYEKIQINISIKFKKLK